MEHHFTDGWATDGSKKKVRGSDGREETRVACGATEGAVPVEPMAGESAAREALRSIGAGLIGCRLPAPMEVVDAELYAVLMALRATAEREGPEGRRVLVMSDSLEALRMTERAWREGVRWTGRGAGRAALLHAINTERAKLQLVVTMWVPAHAGVGANAMADAVAKAHLDDGEVYDVASEVRRHLPAGRTVQTVAGEAWMAPSFDAMREAVGWWVRRRARGGGSATDGQRLGPGWSARRVTRWEAVWEATGARTTATADAGDQGAAAAGEAADGGGPRDLLARAEANEEERQERRKKKGRRKGATTLEVSQDSGRCGVAMAARAGALWEGGTTHGGQGCPACCSHARGWRWVESEGGAPVWRGSVSGAAPVHADMLHVLCGSCEGVEEEARRTGRGELRGALQRCRKIITRKGRNGAPGTISEGRKELVRRIDGAQRALAKGQRATADEREAIRAWLAGDLPCVDGHDKGRVRGLARMVAGMVRRAQVAAEGLRGAWSEAGGAERVRRRERGGYAEGREWKAAAMETWAERVQALRTHSAMGGEGGQRGGWTMARALIQYKQRREREKEARDAGKRAAEP